MLINNLIAKVLIVLLININRNINYIFIKYIYFFNYFSVATSIIVFSNTPSTGTINLNHKK